MTEIKFVAKNFLVTKNITIIFNLLHIQYNIFKLGNLV